ncbi:MAG: CDP-2,3-bis-(O-geranylgeranyl)-sn-glycerol synthase [Nitrososphaerota archaeon]|jgi:CDP-2,3-bis-(O-geranylgeranyl)-sn-glycerol synthase|nr:CDP-2,3-bis-(O-geranylgeranyl)-sn-glycerol synthase [Nitrososphaerota archaeon]
MHIILLIIIQAITFIFPAYCANATPVLAGGGTKIDFGKNFIDGKRIFGDNKTYRGFFTGWIIGTSIGLIECYFLHFPILFAILTPFGALLGDLTAAFIKRRLNITPGGKLPIIDQIDFVIGAIIFAVPLSIIGQIISWQAIIVTLLLTPPIHLLTNICAYKLKLKKHPW